VSLLVRPAAHVRINASGYGAFRAPTLNELYRSFRVGDTLTQANPRLTEEKLSGIETGVTWSRTDERLRLRGVFYRAVIDDPVANVTQTATPTLITRERQNLGRTRSQGLTFEAETAVGPWIQASAGYTFVDARIQEFSVERAIEGNRIPQVPRSHFTFEGRFSRPTLFTLVLQARWVGAQFEDDQNRLTLPSCLSIDGRVSRQVSKRFEVFGAAENAANEDCAAGLTPLRTVGSPRLLRVGVRIN
jgi:outer membrane receptor protein involved in Fe transport